MFLYSGETETHVVPLDFELVSSRLDAVIGRQVTISGVPRLIDGWLRGDKFQLTVRTRRQQFFTPLVNGRIESSSKGSLVFVSYALFPATKVLLAFWTIVLPVLAVVFYTGYKNVTISSALLLFTIAIHVVAVLNFRYHVRITKQMLRDLLS
jgi:hypothetical protein